MQEKLNVLVGILGSCYASGDEHLFRCPYCKHHKRKLSINVEKGVYKCWICDARGKKLSRIVRRFGSFNEQEEWKLVSGEVTNLNDFDDLFKEEIIVAKEQCIPLPDHFHTLCNSSKARQPMAYLKSRGLDERDVLKWKMGFCSDGPYKDRIIIPSFNLEGDLNYFIARTFVDDWRRYINPSTSRDIIFNELYVDFDEEVTLVEGVFDALKAKNAVPLLGSTLREGSRLFTEIVKNDTAVLLALDPDATYKSTNIKNLLLKHGIEVREVKYEDHRDLGEMTKDEVREMSTKAPFVRQYDELLSALGSL